MADEEKKEVKGSVPLETIKVFSESAGIAGLTDEACSYLADDATYRLQLLIQDSVKILRHSKRRRLVATDMDYALRLRNFEPLFGFTAKEPVPFRLASGGGREIHFTEDKEVDLQELVGEAVPKMPLDISVKPHWLSVEGVQPAIPENPAPANAKKGDSVAKAKTPADPSKPKVKGEEKVKLKEIAMHDLSVEQQLYFKEITEACVGSDEMKRTEALQSIQTDPGLHQMLPQFIFFVSEGVKTNIAQNNLALLIYVMRMTKALMDNSNLHLEKYLHDVIPAILSCIVSKQLCYRPETDNHWALRDFAARLMAQLCRMFSSSTNSIQSRVTKLLSNSFDMERAPLATHYGALVGLIEMGSEVIAAFVLPTVKAEGEKLQMALEGPVSNNADKIAAEHIKQNLLKGLPPVLKNLRHPPDMVEEYKQEFGYLGLQLHAAVVKARQTPVTTAASMTMNIRPTISISQPRPQLIIHPQMTPSGLSSPLTPRFGSITSGGQQKYVVISQPRSSAPSTPQPVFPRNPAIVKLGGSSMQAGASAPTQKIMVMSMGQSTGTTITVPKDISNMHNIFGAGASSVIKMEPKQEPDDSKDHNYT